MALEKTRRLEKGLIDDTLAEMEHWACFEQDREEWLAQQYPSSSKSLPGTEEAKKSKKAPPAKSVKVGRNDPCPCGSGKNYKTCCRP